MTNIAKIAIGIVSFPIIVILVCQRVFHWGLMNLLSKWDEPPNRYNDDKIEYRAPYFGDQKSWWLLPRILHLALSSLPAVAAMFVVLFDKILAWNFPGIPVIMQFSPSMEWVSNHLLAFEPSCAFIFRKTNIFLQLETVKSFQIYLPSNNQTWRAGRYTIYR